MNIKLLFVRVFYPFIFLSKQRMEQHSVQTRNVCDRCEKTKMRHLNDFRDEIASYTRVPTQIRVNRGSLMAQSLLYAFVLILEMSLIERIFREVRHGPRSHSVCQRFFNQRLSASFLKDFPSKDEENTLSTANCNVVHRRHTTFHANVLVTSGMVLWCG